MEVKISEELELKLGLPAEAVPKLRKLLQDRAGTPAAAAELVSTYYDTPDGALRQRNMTLRVRQQDGRFIQTVKRDRGDAVRRGEWEDEIAGARPDLMAGRSGRQLPKKLRQKPLQPLFTTSIARTVLDLVPRRAAHIEAAIDSGEIRAAKGAKTAPIQELELELKRGRPSDVYDLALELLEALPLEIGTPSKSERGYGLIAPGDKPVTRTLRPIAVGRDCSAEEGLQRIGRACLAHLLANLPAALVGEPEGVHQIRVAARRLRSFLWAVQPLLPDGQRRWAAEELTRLADGLGPARNWDSLCDGLLAQARGGVSHPEMLDPLEKAASGARAAAHEQASAFLRGRRCAESVLRLLRWFEAARWRAKADTRQLRRLRSSVAKIAPGLLDRCAKQLRKRSRNFQALPPPERHKLRIACKKLRYTVAFFAPLYRRKDVRQYVACLKPLQDALGHANDVRVAYDQLAQLPRERNGAQERAAGLLLGWHEQVAKAAEPRIGAALKRAREAKPFWG